MWTYIDESDQYVFFSMLLMFRYGWQKSGNEEAGGTFGYCEPVMFCLDHSVHGSYMGVFDEVFDWMCL
jgi:hypothetical protein